MHLKVDRRTCWVFWGAIVFALFFFGPVQARANQSSWLRIYANFQETLSYFEGGSFPAGYLTGTSIVQLLDGNLLLAGFVKPVQGNDRRLAVLKVGPEGAFSWYHELGPRAPGYNAPVPLSRRDHLTWAEAVATPDGGAAVVFGSHLVKLNPDGVPEWTRRFVRPITVGDEQRQVDIRLTSLTSREPEGFFLLGVEPENPVRPEVAGHLVLIATDSQGQNPQAKLYFGLQKADRPKLLRTAGGLIVGAEPRAVAKISLDGASVQGISLVSLPFSRGPARRPDRGQLWSYQSLALMEDGDVIFSGVYDLSYPTYGAPGALICRLDPSLSSVRWTSRIHSRIHGGQTIVQAVAAKGNDLFLVGNSSEFGATDPRVNPNALAMKMDGSGNLVWISSLGRKRRSEAKSEYTDEWGLAVAPAADGGLFLAGSANSFSHPVPFHRIRQWATEHCDLLLARFGSDGGLANLPQGRYPAIFNQTDPGDKKKVDVVHPPLAIQDLAVSVSPVEVRALTVTFESITADLDTQYSNDALAQGNKPPVASFTVKPHPGGNSLEALLDAGSSSDPDDDPIAEYRWEFSDGRTAGGRLITYYARSTGNHKVTLTVKDQYGHQSDPLTKEFWMFRQVRDDSLPPGLACGEKAGYEIEVLTGDVQDAGTDARAYLSLWGPADEDGQRCSSGDLNLSVDNTPANKPGTDLFERGQTDSFTFPQQYSDRGRLTEVDYAILRHDNSNNKPGWFVEGFRVRDTTNDQDWYFVPLRWLADNQSENQSTWGQFEPCEPYPRGVMIGCNPGLGWQVTLASDLIVILPQEAGTVYLTAGNRDQELEVYRQGTLIGRQVKNGSGLRRPPYIHPDERGVAVEADQVTAPTRYEFKIRSGGDWRSGVIWLFPHQWADYQATARQVTLLLPLKDQTGEIFGIWDRARTYLLGQSGDYAGALQKIIDYGRDSIGIFGDIPDDALKDLTEDALEQYVENYLVVALASKSVELSADALSEMKTIFTCLTQALDWGLRLGGLLTELQGQVYEGTILREIPGHNSAFQVLGPLIEALKSKTESLIARAEANDPAQCQELMGQIKTLVAGDLAELSQAQIQAGANDPEAFKIDYQALGVSSTTAEHYPLAFLLLSHYHTARDHWANPDLPGEYCWYGTPAQNAGCDALAKYGICDDAAKKAATREAMENYLPFLEGFGSLTAILLNACLTP